MDKNFASTTTAIALCVAAVFGMAASEAALADTTASGAGLALGAGVGATPGAIAVGAAGAGAASINGVTIGAAGVGALVIGFDNQTLTPLTGLLGSLPGALAGAGGNPLAR